MIVSTALELALVALSLACGSAGVLVIRHTRAAAHGDRSAAGVAARDVAAQSRRSIARVAGTCDAVLLDAAQRLANAARESVDAVRAEIARAARALAPALDGVLLYEEHDGALRCVFACGDRFAYFAGARVALDDATSLPARALAAGHRVALGTDGVTSVHPGDEAALAVPLALDAGRVCVLVVAAQDPLDVDAHDRIAMLADLASPAYYIALDREHDRRDAEYDGLTGLLTPRAFRRRLTALVDRARFMQSARLALLFVDTDYFKRWNDSYGHAAGDALLRELARVLRSTAAFERDLVARNGGDEFCVVFTETDKATAIERADALRRQIAAIDPQISASIGVAAFPADAPNANDLLERADGAMYHTKQTGRDGVSYCVTEDRFERLDTSAAA